MIRDFGPQDLVFVRLEEHHFFAVGSRQAHMFAGIGFDVPALQGGVQCAGQVAVLVGHGLARRHGPVGVAEPLHPLAHIVGSQSIDGNVHQARKVFGGIPPVVVQGFGGDSGQVVVVMIEPLPDGQAPVLGHNNLRNFQGFECADLVDQGVEVQRFCMVVEADGSFSTGETVANLAVGAAVGAGSDADAHYAIVSEMWTRGVDGKNPISISAGQTR